MNIDFQEAEYKNNRLRSVLVILCAMIFIVFFSLLGINYAKQYNKKLMAKRKNIIPQSTILENEEIAKIENEVSNQEIEEETEVPEEIIIEENINTQLPIYSAEAKAKMMNIYKTNTIIAYLTFDDGPSEAVTPLILDLLKQESIKATFFVVGSKVEKNPEIVKRAYDEGHYIANHGYTHSYDTIYKASSNPLNEYNRTEECIQTALGNTGYHSHLFRFPGGYAGGKYASIKKEAGKMLNDNNISFIDWNCLTGDAEGANTKEKIMEYITRYTKDRNNIVILMHDASSKILTYETLPEVIQYLRDLGYSFDNFYNIMK